MEAHKALLGKIKLNSVNIIKSAVFFICCVIIISITTITKFIFIDKLVFEKPEFSYTLLVMGFAFFFTSIFIYMLYSRRELINEPKTLFAVCSAVVITYIINLYMSIISILAMPMFLCAFLIAPISKRRDAFVGNIFANLLIVLTLLVQYMGSRDIAGDTAINNEIRSVYEIITIFVIGVTFGSVASYTISNNTKRLNYIWKGLVICLLSYGITLLYCYTNTLSIDEFSKDISIAAVGIFAPIILGLLSQPVFEVVFNLITNSRLVELTDHNSPLIKRLRTETPGTFNHSLAVANFAEICASAIGENPYLARACAYYHDVGKLVNSEYFKENQSEINPHDELLPEVSADIIRGHTTEGLKLCNEYRIPAEISSVTIEHHGTLLIPVFYNKAKQLTDGEVDINEYSYHGVTPVSRVAAIIMLCDVGEAAIRSMTNPDGEKVDKLLTELINNRILNGQFDNCDISLRELDTIKKAIISSYGGLFHKRMQYPEGDKK